MACFVHVCVGLSVLCDCVVLSCVFMCTCHDSYWFLLSACVERAIDFIRLGNDVLMERHMHPGHHKKHTPATFQLHTMFTSSCRCCMLWRQGKCNDAEQTYRPKWCRHISDSFQSNNPTCTGNNKYTRCDGHKRCLDTSDCFVWVKPSTGAYTCWTQKYGSGQARAGYVKYTNSNTDSCEEVTGASVDNCRVFTKVFGTQSVRTATGNRWHHTLCC